MCNVSNILLGIGLRKEGGIGKLGMSFYIDDLHA
jgi:hypothetical protein